MKVRVLSSAPIFLRNKSIRGYPFSSRSSLSTSFSQNQLADVSGMRISKTTNHGNVRWRATASLNGKRRQRFFTSRDDARAWLDSIRPDLPDSETAELPRNKAKLLAHLKIPLHSVRTTLDRFGIQGTF